MADERVPDRAPKRPVTTGRVTPRGGSGRYTPPVPHKVKESGRAVPIVMGTCLGLGFLAIVLNYLGFVPGGTSNLYLLVGLGLITVGFIVATRWR